jgi:hypothetical protein
LRTAVLTTLNEFDRIIYVKAAAITLRRQDVMGKKVQLLDDDTAINVSAEVVHVWSIANTLRGAYKFKEYSFVNLKFQETTHAHP